MLARVLNWLVPARFLPGGGDAYCNRVGRAVGEGIGKLAGSHETFERYARRQRARVERLQPPAGLDAEHARLIELLDEADKRAHDPSLSLKARATETARSLQRAREQRTTLVDRSDESDRRYAKAVADLSKSSEQLIEGAFARAEEGVRAMVAELERSDPPKDQADRHDALIESCRSYLEAMCAYHDAVRELDADRVGAAVNQCEAAKSAIKEKLMALCPKTTLVP